MGIANRIGWLFLGRQLRFGRGSVRHGRHWQGVRQLVTLDAVNADKAQIIHMQAQVRELMRI